MENRNIYTEKQKFNQKWISILINSTCFISIIISIIIYVNAEGALTLIALIPLITGVLPYFLFKKMELILVIDDKKINYRFYPFHNKNKEIRKSDIQEIRVGTYNPIADYGGWGIRFGSKGKAYTVSGSYGIQIKLNNNKNILIGTNNPDEVYNYLKEREYIQ